MKTLKNKFDEFVIKTYVKWTVLMWEVEEIMTDELKKLTKR